MAKKQEVTLVLLPPVRKPADQFNWNVLWELIAEVQQIKDKKKQDPESYCSTDPDKFRQDDGNIPTNSAAEGKEEG